MALANCIEATNRVGSDLANLGVLRKRNPNNKDKILHKCTYLYPGEPKMVSLAKQYLFGLST